jgi:hypothetical protein
MSNLDNLFFGPGYCKDCGLIKPLVMTAIPGLHEDEHGELTGGSIAIDPLERSGYCRECAIKMLEKTKKKN